MGDFRQYNPHSTQSRIRERKLYDVFLSFRGPDVRESFVDHLHQSLSTAGVNVFIDSEELEKGKIIGMNLEQAIQNSTIYIPIFSPDYASSEWCLKEISLMWNIKSTTTYPILMIPLFFNVKPSEVRYAGWTGPYAEAFRKHERKGRHSPEEMQSWRNALGEVSCLSGWSLKETSFGYEGKLVRKVVEDVLRALHIGVLDVAKRPVGLTDLCEEVLQLLKLGDNTSDRLTLGIWGMGGLGKSTLSKALYNKIHNLFPASCFLSNVKAEDRTRGLRKLQQQILRDLLKREIKLSDTDSGKIVMRNRLSSLRALVVLDDVDDVQQMDALVGDWFGEGSRIIITSRDQRVLEERQVAVIYPMRRLDLAQSVELFSWHAFLRARPERGFEDRTQRIVRACSGLPLSLEIVGSYLYNRHDSRYWDETLHKLENVDHRSVFETLKISYDSLTPVEKHVFLDIACFFVNLKSSIFIQPRAFNMDFYCRFWSALGWEPVYTTLKTLEEKALIVIDEHRYSESIVADEDEEDQAGQYFCAFSMHEQIRDMGRRIVREESWNDPTKRSRLWQENDIRILMAATNIQENSSVEGFVWRRRMELHHIDGLAPLQKLDFLLWWKLKVETHIKRLPTNLKYLVLSDCELMDYDPQIEMSRIESGSGHNGSSVLSPVLPESISQLIYLQYLDMSGTKQTCLPKEVCELHCLEELYLSRCNLEALPEAFGKLINLKTLDVSHNFLSEFPSGFQFLQSLRNLEMAWNGKLVIFPELPTSLFILNARGCSKLQVVSLKNHLAYLKTMNLSYCKSITRLPSLTYWKSLRNLYLDGCKQLVELEGPFPNRLACLRISGCSQLQKFSFDPPPFVLHGLSRPPSQRVCMIGCDNIRLDIYQLLKDFDGLEQMDFSVSPGEELPGETLPLVGQRNLTLQKSDSSVVVLFCFVFGSNENAHLPEMKVVVTSLGEGHACSYSQTFKLASHLKEDGGRENILRVCVCQNRNLLRGGVIKCSYVVENRVPQDESPALLRQAEILVLKGDATSRKAKQFLEQWKLLPPSNDNKT